MELIRGISGIRGIALKTLSKDTTVSHVKAFSEIQKPGDILIARDSRPHGELLSQVAISAVIKSGRNAWDAGIISTPTAQFLIEKYQLAGGVVITASHNPIEWNGLKFIDNDGCFLNGEKNSILFELADGITETINRTPGNTIKFTTGSVEHIEHTLKLNSIDASNIRKREFTVVVDAVNGAASTALPKLLKEFGCNVIPVYCFPDGHFQRGTEPLPENLAILGETVREHNADVGFATDPDGDRLAVVDENGKPIGEEYTLVICTDGFLSSIKTSAPIVTNLSTTMALDKVAEKYGIEIKRSAVGEINVVNQMKAVGAQLGGEGNGGVILRESHYGRDSLVGIAMFLHRMAFNNESVSEIFKSMPQFVMKKEKIQLVDNDADGILDMLSKSFPEAQKNTIDGLKLIWKDKWLHVRKSNTEPILRIYTEATTHSNVDKLVKQIRKQIGYVVQYT